MKANITASQIYWNPKLKDFFFRSQADETFEKVFAGLAPQEQMQALDTLDEMFDELDDCEEMLYTDTAEEILTKLGFPPEKGQDNEL